MEKKCENCKFYHKLFGAEYCLLDVQTKWWEQRRKKYEIFCDHFLSRNASFEESMQWTRKEQEKYNKFEIPEE